MTALVIEVANEGRDVCLKITWQELVFQYNAVLQSLMPSFDLALGLRMIWRPARMFHAFVLQPFRQIP